MYQQSVVSHPMQAPKRQHDDYSAYCPGNSTSIIPEAAVAQSKAAAPPQTHAQGVQCRAMHHPTPQNMGLLGCLPVKTGQVQQQSWLMH